MENKYCSWFISWCFFGAGASVGSVAGPEGSAIAGMSLAGIAETIAADERFHDICMDIISEFIDKEIPIVNEEDKWDLGLELSLRITTRSL